MASANHDSARMLPSRRFRLTFGLLTTVTPSLKHPEALRFARPTRHILSQFSTQTRRVSIGRKAIAGCFQRGSFRLKLLRKLVTSSTNQLRSLGAYCVRTAAQTTSTTYRLARMNSRNLINIATHFRERQPHYAASNHENRTKRDIVGHHG